MANTIQQQLIRKIIWKRENKGQVVGAVLGTGIGLLLLLLAVQAYLDFQKLLQGNEANQDYVIINKRVNLFNTLGVKSTFTDEEVEELKAQPFIEEVGQFIPNMYKVSASSRMLGFYTELFFESVSEHLLDVSPSGFSWKKGQNELPIVLSRDYLALYNFGFAPAQGLPPFTAKTIQRVTVDVNISGNGLKKTFQGRIVGFSDRINSILVPESFQQWANEQFGEGRRPDPSRLILSTSQAETKEFQGFMKDKGYEVSRGRLIGGQASTLIKLILYGVALIGVIIVLLSVLIFLLNYQLLISRSRADLSRLLQVGYRPAQISGILTKSMAWMLGVTLVATLLILALIRLAYGKWLQTQGLDLGLLASWLVVVLAFILGGVFYYLTARQIRGEVARL